ncbi:MAG: ATP synthase F0 subunit B [Desulfosarcina sp.]|nr:ATP synthase F0 subunit B [Desulfobacterales bacterium]
MQIISNIALISINETLFIQLISFLIFVFLINRIMFRPLVGEMSKRGSYFENLRQEIIAAGHSLEDLNAQLQERESEARIEAMGLKEELEEEGAYDASGIIEAARNDVMAIKTKAESEVDKEIVEARKFLKKESEALALGIMEKVLDRRLG